MNFKELRRQILGLSGRTDLVDADTLADTGIGYFLNAGQRWLDSKLTGKHTKARNFSSWNAGTYTITIPACRVIEEVWIYDSESRLQLEKKSVNWLMRNYTKSWRLLDAGAAKYFAPVAIQLNPDASKLTISEFTAMTNMINTVAVDATGIEGLIILPPPSEDFNIEVIGHFFSNKFVKDTDKSWWSVNYPNVLVNAALREVEIGHRNTQGVNDWTNAIADMLASIDFDNVEEEIYGINRING